MIAALMPPPVTAAVIAVIGIGLAPVGWGMASADWTLALLTLAIAIVVAVATRGFTKLIPILIAVVAGYVIAALMGKVDFAKVVEAAWIGLPDFVLPTFSVEAMSLIVPVVVMLVAENLGHVKAISAYMDRDLTPEVGNAFMGDALATFVSALGGGTGQTTYAENIGVMSITKVYSIRPLQVAAVTAILLGFIPKFGAIIQSIPVPVMGGISLMLFGLIAGTSTKVISSAKEDWGTLENFGTFGISVAVCAAMVAVFQANGAVNGAMAEAIKAGKFAALPTAIQLGPVSLDAIGASTFAAVLLNLVMVVVKKLSPFVDDEVAVGRRGRYGGRSSRVTNSDPAQERGRRREAPPSFLFSPVAAVARRRARSVARMRIKLRPVTEPHESAIRSVWGQRSSQGTTLDRSRRAAV